MCHVTHGVTGDSENNKEVRQELISRAVLSNAVATTHMWLLILEIWLVQTETCYNYKMYTGFYQISMKKDYKISI